MKIPHSNKALCSCPILCVSLCYMQKAMLLSGQPSTVALFTLRVKMEVSAHCLAGSILGAQLQGHAHYSSTLTNLKRQLKSYTNTFMALARGGSRGGMQGQLPLLRTQKYDANEPHPSLIRACALFTLLPRVYHEAE